VYCATKFTAEVQLLTLQKVVLALCCVVLLGCGLGSFGNHRNTPIATAIDTSIILATEKRTLELPTEESKFFSIFTRFLFVWRGSVTTASLPWAPKARFCVFRTAQFFRKSPWAISVLPGLHCIEQAQGIVGGSELASPRQGGQPQFFFGILSLTRPSTAVRFNCSYGTGTSTTKHTKPSGVFIMKMPKNNGGI
jgi:hypothetical protein